METAVARPTALEVARPWYRRRQVNRIVHALLVYALVIPGAILLALPFYWMASTALKDPKHIFLIPPEWIPNPMRWENFWEGWTKYVPFTLYLRNSLIITVGNILGNLFSCSLAAYGFARLRARGKNFLFMLVLGTMMLPGMVTLIPQYVLFSMIKWTDTFLPLMVPAWFGWPLFIFLLRQFFMTIPRELDDAARIDGCSTWGILWRIILPLSGPALATVVVFGFVGNWNNFLGPLVYLRDNDLYTLALGLMRFQGVQGNMQFHYMMAVATLTVLPIIILFFIAQRYFVQGIVMSGIKG